VSFWELPRFIRSLEATGFSALSHRLHWHSLLAEPLLYCAMVLIAAIFSLRHTRLRGVLFAVAGGIATGFVLFFMSDLVLALAHSTRLPPMLAAWAPALASSMIGLAVLIHVEDG
jgi:lipopolysaccharide export system permease protein